LDGTCEGETASERVVDGDAMRVCGVERTTRWLLQRVMSMGRTRWRIRTVVGPNVRKIIPLKAFVVIGNLLSTPLVN
jgi:hypothetical protein